MKKILVAVFAFLTLGLAGILATPAHTVYADATSDVCSGLGAAAKATGDTACGDSSGKINNAIAGIVNIFSMIVGIVAVIVIVVAGFRYTTSGGDSSKINSAKTELTYAIVGLIVVALAQSIVKFVLDKST